MFWELDRLLGSQGSQSFGNLPMRYIRNKIKQLRQDVNVSQVATAILVMTTMNINIDKEENRVKTFHQFLPYPQVWEEFMSDKSRIDRKVARAIRDYRDLDVVLVCFDSIKDLVDRSC